MTKRHQSSTEDVIPGCPLCNNIPQPPVAAGGN